MKKHGGRVLVYDIETGPNLGYVWQKYQTDVIAFKEDWELLSFAFKWLGDKKTIAYGRNHYTEEELTLMLYNLFNEADVVIAHNGDNFDQRMANVKFIQYGLTPPAPYKSIDTKKIAKRYFRFTSNKLDDLGKFLGLGRKVQTGGFELWLGCMEGDKASWSKMLRYNKQDVQLLESIYMRLRPWAESHPPMGLMDGQPDACEVCGYADLERRGYRYTQKRKYARLCCKKCGHWQKGELVRH
jgi:hypothetical protein